MSGRHIACLAALAAISMQALAVDVPTFEQLDKELNSYKGRAHLEGATNAHLDMDGLAYYCVFDLVLTVLNNPEHPKYAETKKAWDTNQAKFVEQAGLVALMMGKNLLPLLITSSEKYAEGFKDGAKLYAPLFNPSDYLHPFPARHGEGDGASPDTTSPDVGSAFAWFHAFADADGDGISNKDELLKVAPNWLPVKDANGTVKEGTGLGVTEEERDKFVEEALGCKSWRMQAKGENPDANVTKTAE